MHTLKLKLKDGTLNFEMKKALFAVLCIFVTALNMLPLWPLHHTEIKPCQKTTTTKKNSSLQQHTYICVCCKKTAQHSTSNAPQQQKYTLQMKKRKRTTCTEQTAIIPDQIKVFQFYSTSRWSYFLINVHVLKV